MIEEASSSHSYRNKVIVSSISFPVLLSPPVGICLVCSHTLTEHNRACDVVIYGLLGKASGLKFSLRCDQCKINYNYDQYGNKTRGWCLYEGIRPLVEASDVCFVEWKLLDLQCALA